jgi:uncharacterized protein YwlG (UPF0340 family)
LLCFFFLLRVGVEPGEERADDEVCEEWLYGLLVSLWYKCTGVCLGFAGCEHVNACMRKDVQQRQP